MGWLGRVFGTDKAIEKGFDMVVDAGDKMVYTKEEKAEGFQRLLELYEPFKIAQRILMVVVGVPFVFIHTCAALSWLAAIFVIESDERYLLITGRLGELMAANNDTLGLPFAIIVGFYFGGGAVEGVVNRFRKK